MSLISAGVLFLCGWVIILTIGIWFMDWRIYVLRRQQEQEIKQLHEHISMLVSANTKLKLAKTQRLTVVGRDK